MPQYHLIYFDARGRGELTRWLLEYSGTPYTEERIAFGDWAVRKQSIPTGKVPILMVDGRPLAQSLAIARYLAKEVGLVPKDNLEAAFGDALADTIAEMMAAFYKNKMSSVTEDEKERKFNEEINPNIIRPLLGDLNKHLADRSWYSSGQMSWIDLMIAVEFGGLRKSYPKLLDDFPKVAGHVDKVMALPSISAWVKRRPDTFL